MCNPETVFSKKPKLEFPGNPVAETLCTFTAEGLGWIPGWGTRILQAAWPKKKHPKPKQNKQEGPTSSAHLQDLHVDLVGFCQLHAIDLNVLKGRNVTVLGCLLQAAHHLVHSGSLPCPRDPGDVHAPGARGEDPGLGLCSCVNYHQLWAWAWMLKPPEVWRWED